MNIIKTGLLIRPRILQLALRNHSTVVGHPLVAPQILQNFRGTYENEIKRGHKNLGHRPRSIPTVSKVYYCFIVFGMIFALIDWRKYGSTISNSIDFLTNLVLFFL